jgi:hypothetical protein
MKHHYLELMPEWLYIREKSRRERELELLRHSISFQRVLLREHIRTLASIKSPEDQHIYIEYLQKEFGKGYAIDLMRRS